MTIGEMLDLCFVAGMLTVEIYDLDKERTVWTGDGDEVPDEYLDAEIESWDLPAAASKMTFNICA